MEEVLRWLSQPAVFPWVALAFGLCVGSFLNVVIHRLPRMMEREWREQCAELETGTGELGVEGRGTGKPPGSPVPIVEKYNLVVPRSTCPQCGHKIKAIENIPLLSYAMLRGRC